MLLLPLATSTLNDCWLAPIVQQQSRAHSVQSSRQRQSRLCLIVAVVAAAVVVVAQEVIRADQIKAF